MFTLSAKAVYGLTAVLELAKSYNHGPTQIRDIADSNEIPQHYLEQLLVVLKKSGVVESYRGAQGGYALARPPREIRVIEVIASLDGKLEVVHEQRREGPLLFFWNTLERSIAALLDKTVEELLVEKQAAAEQIVYHI